MRERISVAIDGPSGAGKSTMARKAAAELGFLYVDTGAIYRTVALYCYRAGIAREDADAITACLPDIHVELSYGSDGVQRMSLNGEDVTDAIRQSELSLYTSAVSAIPAVRAFLLEQQRALAAAHDVVMDGRDIGTVVLPDAQVKIFLTAAPEERARRRWNELRQRDSAVEYEQVLDDVLLRDENDRNRPIAPLRQAEDAVLVDTTHVNLEESLRLLLDAIRGRL